MVWPMMAGTILIVEDDKKTAFLVARVKAILRRGRLVTGKDRKLLSLQGLAIDPEKRKVTLNGHPVLLTSHEFNLLLALMSSPGKFFTRDEIRIWVTLPV